MTTDADGNIYVGSLNGRRVEKFDPLGNPLPFTGSATYIEGNRLVGTPAGSYPDLSFWRSIEVSIDSSGGPNDGNIYLSIEGEGESRVFVYDSTGIYLGRLGPTTDYRCGAVVNPVDGSVYIGQSFVGGIQRYAPPGPGMESAIPTGAITLPGCAFAVDGTGAIYFGGGPYGGPTAKYPASEFGVDSPTPSIVVVPSRARGVGLVPV